MSHITVGSGCGVVVTDINAVRIAARELGMKVLRQTGYRWYGGDGGAPETAEYVLRLNDDKTDDLQRKYGKLPYDLAMIPAKGGGWHLACDDWEEGYGLIDVVGATIHGKHGPTIAPRFIQEYRLAAAILAARESGDELEVQRHPDGTITAEVAVARV